MCYDDVRKSLGPIVSAGSYCYTLSHFHLQPLNCLGRNVSALILHDSAITCSDGYYTAGLCNIFLNSRFTIAVLVFTELFARVNSPVVREYTTCINERQASTPLVVCRTSLVHRVVEGPRRKRKRFWTCDRIVEE